MKVKQLMMETIKIAELRWFRHMKSITDSSFLEKIYTNGQRKRRRPKLTWTQSITQTIRDRGLGYVA